MPAYLTAMREKRQSSRGWVRGSASTAAPTVAPIGGMFLHVCGLTDRIELEALYI